MVGRVYIAQHNTKRDHKRLQEGFKSGPQQTSTRNSEQTWLRGPRGITLNTPGTLQPASCCVAVLALWRGLPRALRHSWYPKKEPCCKHAGPANPKRKSDLPRAPSPQGPSKMQSFRVLRSALCALCSDICALCSMLCVMFFDLCALCSVL